MAFIPVANCVRVKIGYRNTRENEAFNIIHIDTDETTPSYAVIEGILDLVAAWLAAEWAPVAAADWRAVSLEGTALDSPTGLQLARTVSISGTMGGEALPPQDTIAMSLRSVWVGRSRRGRLYHVGLSEFHQEGGYITTDYAESLIEAYEALREAIETATFKWVVVSYVTDGAPRAEGLTTQISNVILTDRIIDSMDTRKPRT